MSSGGKGGGQTSQVTIPKYIEDASKKNLERADYFSQVGYVPYYGPDVAALSPMEEQAMRGTGSAMQAFGLADQGYDPLAGMPNPRPLWVDCVVTARVIYMTMLWQRYRNAVQLSMMQ